MARHAHLLHARTGVGRALTQPRPNDATSSAAHDRNMKAFPRRAAARRHDAGPTQNSRVAGDVVAHGYKLACSTCGRQLHDHSGSPPDCEGFVRPVLSAGLTYADALPLGAAFRFLSRGRDARVHVLRREPVLLDETNGLLELQTSRAGANAATYLVEATSIVELATAPELVAA